MDNYPIFRYLTPHKVLASPYSLFIQSQLFVFAELLVLELCS